MRGYEVRAEVEEEIDHVEGEPREEERDGDQDDHDVGAAAPEMFGNN